MTIGSVSTGLYTGIDQMKFGSQPEAATQKSQFRQALKATATAALLVGTPHVLAYEVGEYGFQTPINIAEFAKICVAPMDTSFPVKQAQYVDGVKSPFPRAVVPTPADVESDIWTYNYLMNNPSNTKSSVEIRTCTDENGQGMVIGTGQKNGVAHGLVAFAPSNAENNGLVGLAPLDSVGTISNYLGIYGLTMPEFIYVMEAYAQGRTFDLNLPRKNSQ